MPCHGIFSTAIHSALLLIWDTDKLTSLSAGPSSAHLNGSTTRCGRRGAPLALTVTARGGIEKNDRLGKYRTCAVIY